MNPESPRHRESVKQKIAEIEAEMKNIHMWQEEPLKDVQLSTSIDANKTEE